MVEGKQLTHYIGPGGTNDVTPDFTLEPLTAFTLKDSTFTPVKPVYGVNGAFKLQVAKGETYYVGQNGSYVVTDARSIDLGSNRQGRGDQRPLDAGVPTLALTMTGLGPWQMDDSLELVTESVFDYAQLYPESTAVQDNATTTSGLRFSWSSILQPYGIALETSKGDTATLVQMRTRPFASDGGYDQFCQSVVSSGATGKLSTSEGATTSLTVSMSAPTLKPATFDVRRSEWATLTHAVHPDAKLSWFDFEVDAVPNNLDHGWIGYLHTNLYCAFYEPVADGPLTISWGNPVSTWAELAVIGAGYEVPIETPDGGTASYFPHISNFDTTSALLGAPLSPAMSPAVSVAIDGMAAQGKPFNIASQTPKLSWSAPQQGKPTYYFVYFRRLYQTATGATKTRGVGGLLTTKTEVRVPPGLLSSGSYLAGVQAYDASGGGFNASSAPWYDPAKSRGSVAVTSTFRVP